MTCACGCGAETALAAYSDRRCGIVKGQPLRFIRGHNARKRRDWLVRDDGCWDWQGTLTTEGYGVLRVDYVQVKAHRWVYEQERGPIPEGMVIDHLCSNKRCVNPEHLRVTTPSENSSRYWREEWDGDSTGLGRPRAVAA